MDASRREMFNKFFNALVDREGAFALRDKLALVDRLYADAAERGTVPISLTQLARVTPDSQRVQAIQAGLEVSSGGVSVQRRQTSAERLAGLSTPVKLLLLLLVMVVPTVLLVAVSGLAHRAPAATATATVTVTPTVTPTITRSPTAVPTAGAQATPYALVVDTSKVPTGPNDPVSIDFSGQAFVLRESSLTGGVWAPAVAEWLSGTELRRVVAVPYSQEVGQAVARMKYGDPLQLRLLSGEVMLYRLTDIRRVQRHQIEILNDLTPSLAVELHGERSGERWVLIAEAVQGPLFTPTPTASPSATASPVATASPLTATETLTATAPFTSAAGVTATLTPTLALATATPTLSETPTATATATASPSPVATATPAATATPVLKFTPPLAVTQVITDALTVDNAAAGLRLTIGVCNRVAQIGAKLEGTFVVCDVTLTADQDGAVYSGQTLAITEFAQVNQSTDWWPPSLNVVGAIGDGTLGAGGAVSGKVAGAVAKAGLGAEPVLLWEQAGIRQVIYLHP